MIAFLGRRLLTSCGLIFLISILSYFLITLTPGSPFPWGDLNPSIAAADKEAARARFHLDRPIYEQYWLIMRDLATGRLVSMKDGQPVLTKIAQRLPATLLLASTALVFIYGFGVLLGVQGARERGRWPDQLGTVIALAGTALPSFCVAYLLVVVLANTLQLPVLGTNALGLETAPAWRVALDRAWHVLVPAALLALGGIAAQSRYVRASLLGVLRQDYVRTARAKGVADSDVFYRHALGNALRPLITNFGLLLPALLGGSVIIETIFAWPGIGRLGYEAVLDRDYPLLVALNLVSAAAVILGSLLADVLYAVADPRVRLA